MRLELATFPVKDVLFGDQTKYDKGILQVDKKELLSIVMKDKLIESADLDIAFPGEKTRIVKIRDVVEPRIKVKGPGCVFPGILGPVESVGEGLTHRISKVTVMASVKYRGTIQSGSDAECSGLVDMWGPGSSLTPFGSTINIILVLELIDGITELDAHETIQLAELRIAHRLAETTKNMSPESVEVFELSETNHSLPRVVYIMGAMGMVDDFNYTNLFLYGLPVKESLATLIHPNEIIDGAVTCNARHGCASFVRTWSWMNNAVLLNLLREHGKSINLLGVILQRTRFATEHGKQVAAKTTSQMISQIKADGAIITASTPSGNSFMDTMLTLLECEKKGIKTVLLAPEWSPDSEAPLPYCFPEATAVVSSGAWINDIKLPKPNKIIGAKAGELVSSGPQYPSFYPIKEIILDGTTAICNGIDWLGHMCNTCQED